MPEGAPLYRRLNIRHLYLTIFHRFNLAAKDILSGLPQKNTLKLILLYTVNQIFVSLLWRVITTKMSDLLTSKFVRLLQTFDEAEVKGFDIWLRSPWCNANKNLPRLLACLKPYYPGYSDPKLTKERLFRQILPKGKFSERRINNLLSEAYLAAEKFLVFQRFSMERGMQEDLLAREFQSRRLDDWFFKTSTREIDLLEAKPVKDWEDHLGLFRLHRRIYQHPNADSRIHGGHATLEKMNTHLDLLYLLEKAAVINEMIFRNRFYQEDHFDVSAALRNWNKVAEGGRHPALDLYRMRFSGNDKDLLLQFQHLKAAFMERFDALNAHEQRIHLLSLLNDAKQLIKAGALDITESLPLYQLGLTAGILLTQGQLTQNTYMTIVSASNTKGAFDFTARFMDTYTVCLAEEIRDDCAHWARAHTAYWQKDLETCLTILQAYHFRNVHFQMISRVLGAQAYFDLYLADASYQSYLFHFLDAFEKWLSRDKIWAKSNTGAFLRFVQVCRALARYYADADPKPQKIKNLLKNEHNIQALNWLKLKLEEVLRLKAKRAAQK